MFVARYHFQRLRISWKDYYADFLFSFDKEFLFKEFTAIVNSIGAFLSTFYLPFYFSTSTSLLEPKGSTSLKMGFSFLPNGSNDHKNFEVHLLDYITLHPRGGGGGVTKHILRKLIQRQKLIFQNSQSQ